MAQVKFYRGVVSKYNATTHKDGIYFSTDTNEIILNDVKYGISKLQTGLLGNAISTVDFTSPNIIKFTSNAGSTVATVTLPVASSTANGLFSSDDKKKLDELMETGGAPNVIETIKLDGLKISPDSLKAVNIILSDKYVSLETGKRLVTNEEITKYEQAATLATAALASIEEETLRATAAEKAAEGSAAAAKTLAQAALTAADAAQTDATSALNSIGDSTKGLTKEIADTKAIATDTSSKLETFLKDADMSSKAIDTLKEIQTYITSDGSAASALLGRVDGLETTVGGAESGLVKEVADIKTNYTKVSTTNALTDRVDSLEAKAGTTTDKVAAAQAAATEATRIANTKVDAVDGKSLISDTEITKLSAYPAYSEILSAINNGGDGLTSEIAARKAVTGINQDTYKANTSAPYISTATSLNDADVKLATQISANSEAISTEVTNRTTAVSNAITTANSYTDDALTWHEAN